MLFLVSHVSGQRQTWCISEPTPTGEALLEALRRREGNACEVVLQSHGHIIGPSSPIDDGSTVVATLRLPGGKGGFGSMLRAIGAQIEKTTNREACRDLSGRRLRDINEEKRLKDFISKKADRERELQEKKRQKFKMLEESPRHTFQDESYFQQRERREKNLYDSLDKAFQKDQEPSSTKRSLKEEPVAKAKKAKFIDDLDESSSEEEEDNGEKEAGKEQQKIDNSKPNTKQEEDKKATKQSTALVPEKDCGSSATKRSMEEGPVARIKKGRFMDDLNDSSSEEEEEKDMEKEIKPHACDNGHISTGSSSNQNTTKQVQDTEATSTPTDDKLQEQ